MEKIRRTIEGLPQQWVSLAIVLLAGAALLPAWFNYDIIARDGAITYIPVAKSLMHGKSYVQNQTPTLPLFPVLMVIVSKISGLGLEISGRLISAASFALASLGIFKLSELIFKDRWIALLSAVFLMCNTELLYRSVDCLRESLLVCIMIWANYLILKGIYLPKGVRYFVFGILMFLVGTLVRSTSLFFLGAWFLVWVFHKKQYVVAKILFIVLPITGIFVFLYTVFWYTNPSMPPEAQSFYLDRLQYYVFPGFSQLLKLIGFIILHFFSAGNPAVILFGFIGLYLWKKDAYFFHVCLVLIMFFVCLVVMGSLIEWIAQSDRYILSAIMWMYPIAAYAIVKTIRSKNRVFVVFAILTIVSCPILWADKVFTPPAPDMLARKEAGQLILSQIGPNQEIISNEIRMVFYAKGKLVPFDSAQDIEKLTHCVAIDVKAKTEEGDGEKAKEMLDKAGIKPDKVVGPVYVYFPRS